MKKLLFTLTTLLFTGYLALAQVPARNGWWKFEDANDMLKASVGNALTLTGTQTQVAGPVGDNFATQIGKGSYLALTHGFAPSLGGTKVNEYSVQIDFSVPSVGVWHSFIQTTVANDNDADLFTNTNNQVGVAEAGYSAGTVEANTWYRMVVSVKNGEFFKVYINGELWVDKDLDATYIDGRWALENALLIFGDNDGDDDVINCSELAIWNVALTANQVAELGDAATVELPSRKGLWTFEDANDLLKADVGNALTLTGTQTSVAGPVPGNLATQLALGNYLTMNHGLTASLGGTKVNEYTVQIDFSVPEIDKWHSFIQTTVANDNDADLFTNTSNQIGTSESGYSANAIAQNTWYRMLISVKNGEFFKVYINGELWVDKALDATYIDGRWALDNALLIFGDNDGDDATINCSELAIWDVALSESQAKLLGDAATVEIPVAKGLWKFDNTSNLLMPTLGAPLELTGTQTSVQGPEVGNMATTLDLGNYLTMTHGIAANGGGTKVNEYTLLFDFTVAEANKWHAFFQTTLANDDDADLFTNTSNNIGTSATGYSANAIAAGLWYRMIVSVKNGQFFNVYLNGELWLKGNVQDVDGRWALADKLLIFADNDGDDAAITCSELAIWDVALTEAQAFQLGRSSETVLVTGITVSGEGGKTGIDTNGGTLQMVATVLPENATNKSITWSIAEGADFATLSTDGLLTAIKNGVVTVKATANDGSNVSGTAQITISNQPVILVTGIVVDSEGGAISIETKGGTLQMYATVTPANATTKDVSWSVINGTGSATIDQNGLVTAVSDGTVGIRATAKDGSGVYGGTALIISNQTVIRQRVGLWQFDEAGNLLKATIGSPLVLTGSQTSVEGPITGNLATQVPLGSFLTMTHGIAPNGGGTMVNEYTLQIDFKLPQIDTWYAFFQTSDGDADLFVAKTAAPDISRVPNSIGSGSLLYSQNTVSANSWYRMLVSVKNGEFARIYINGELWLEDTRQTVDGRYALNPTLMIFQDDDGDDGTIICSEIGIWDAALTAAEARDLGDPTKSTTGFGKKEALGFTLSQNFPNPFSDFTTFSYKVDEESMVSFRILDISGKEMQAIDHGKRTPGEYTLGIDARDLNAGIYFLQMRSNGGVYSQKFIVVK